MAFWFVRRRFVANHDQQPRMVRLTDQANTFTGYYSSDGTHWMQIGTAQSIAMPSAITLGGLWASSNSNTALNTTQFSSVSLMRGGWTDADIGSPPITGGAEYDAPSDTTTISGNGADIFGTSDQFNFASTNMVGDGSESPTSIRSPTLTPGPRPG